ASINKVSDMVGEINAASQEQAHGIEQVNTAILQMDEVTQQNAALVEETTATSDTLASEAEKLAGLMGQFRVDDGHAGPPRPPAPKMTTQTPAAPKAGPARKAGGFLSKRGAAKPAPQPVARDASADEGMDF
ncbi:MAG: methyl-accepting chemotaxis protein, partial [Nitrospirae bacterium]|nr:methyl-accepting chemotaxis protein [Nitrospirota bacterium]